MPSTKILFFFYGDLFPVDAGNKRLIVDILSYLKSTGKFDITLALACSTPHDYAALQALCHRLLIFAEPVDSVTLHILNYPFIKSGLTTLRCLVFALSLRRKLKEYYSEQDCIIINYIFWKLLIPRKFLSISAVITHDLQFFREQSFAGNNPSFARKIHIILNRKLELSALKKFWRVVVLADYEYQLLRDLKFPMAKVITIGMPLYSVKSLIAQPPVYDFLMVGGNSLQNESGLRNFVEKILPLCDRDSTIGVVGSLGNSPYCQKLAAVDPRIRLLGFIDDLASIYAQTKIVVSTPLFGSGIKVKTVEAMQNGKCVLANDKGLEGIPWTDQSVINMDHHSAAELTEILNSVLHNPSRSEQYGKCAQDIIDREFSASKTLKPFLEDICKR